MWLLIGVPGVFVKVGIAWVVLQLFIHGRSPMGKETFDECKTKKSVYAGADCQEAPRCGYDVECREGPGGVLHALEVSDSTYERWRNQYGGMKSEEAKRLKQLEDENKRLKELDIQMLEE